jgi:hypothetical protein
MAQEPEPTPWVLLREVELNLLIGERRHIKKATKIGSDEHTIGTAARLILSRKKLGSTRYHDTVKRWGRSAA